MSEGRGWLWHIGGDVAVMKVEDGREMVDVDFSDGRRCGTVWFVLGLRRGLASKTPEIC